MKKQLLLVFSILLWTKLIFAQGVLDVSIAPTGGSLVDSLFDEDDNFVGLITLEISSDDAEQENDQIDALNDDDLDAGWEGEEGDANILTTGLRFQNLQIPQGATIDSAFIVVVSHEAKDATDVAEITIWGDATDDAATFTEDALITDRPRTSAEVEWRVAEEWGLWTTEKSVDVSPIIQEIVNRGGWAPGNSLALILEGNDQGPSEVENAREFQSFENIADPADGGDGRNYQRRAPRLVVYYDGYDGEAVTYELGISSFANNAIDVYITSTGGSLTDSLFDENDNFLEVITLEISSDDAEQENDEIDALNDDDLDVGWEGQDGDANVLTTGLRFKRVGIPQGSTIDSAFFVFVSHEAKAATDVAEITITGEATGDAETFDETNLITARPRTSASVDWVVNVDWGLWTTERSVDISSIVQEIVNREDWVSGNDMAFILEGNDQGPSEVENAREFQSFENIADPADGGNGGNDPRRAPRLVVYYGGYTGDPIQVDLGINSFANGGGGSILSVEEDLNKEFSGVYPNPTSGLINLVLENSSPATISITQLNGGRRIKTFGNDGMKTIRMNLSHLQTGMYIITVVQNGKTYNKQIILE